MKNKVLLLLIIVYFIITSCKSFSLTSSNYSFNNQFFNNPAVIYNLKKYVNSNQINILDSKRIVTKRPVVFKSHDNEFVINIVVDKNDSVNYNIQQYTVNEDLAFVVIWEYGKNRALWFFLNKGKKTKKWYLLEALERTTR